MSKLITMMYVQIKKQYMRTGIRANKIVRYN